jgi:hypothetical protein
MDNSIIERIIGNLAQRADSITSSDQKVVIVFYFFEQKITVAFVTKCERHCCTLGHDGYLWYDVRGETGTVTCETSEPIH